MGNIEFTIKYNRRNKLNKRGEAEITIRAYQNSRNGGRPREKYFGTGVFAQPQNWDEKRKKIKGEKAETKNELIRQSFERLQGFVAKEEINGNAPTLEQVEDFFTNRRVNDFFEFAKLEIEKANIKEGTRKSKRARLENIMSFKDRLAFAEVDYKYMVDVERYLNRRGYKTNYVDKMMTDLIQYCGEAVRRGYIDANKNPFNDYRHKREMTVKDYITEDEIELLENAELPRRLIYSRDLYLFSCYTGLSYCDYISLKKSDIDNTGLRTYIRRKRQKSGVNLDIPISSLSHGKAIEIIDKYKQADREEIFSFINLQTINKNMKDICSAAGIDKHLTTSTGRITRACTLSRKGAADSTIQNTLGHTKLTTTMQYYVKTSRETLADDLERIDC